jgi:predicted metal-dependent hydrolase
MEAAGAATRSDLGRGRHLFNAGRFFEAHEVWEEAWLREQGETRRLLQGLIQVAAGYHHAFDRRQAHGCAWLLEAGWNRLGTLPERAGGLDPSAFREAVALSLKKARAWNRGEAPGLEPGDAPRLRLSRG